MVFLETRIMSNECLPSSDIYKWLHFCKNQLKSISIPISCDNFDKNPMLAFVALQPLTSIGIDIYWPVREPNYDRGFSDMWNLICVRSALTLRSLRIAFCSDGHKGGDPNALDLSTRPGQPYNPYHGPSCRGQYKIFMNKVEEKFGFGGTADTQFFPLKLAESAKRVSLESLHLKDLNSFDRNVCQPDNVFFRPEVLKTLSLVECSPAEPFFYYLCDKHNRMRSLKNLQLVRSLSSHSTFVLLRAIKAGLEVFHYAAHINEHVCFRYRELFKYHRYTLRTLWVEDSSWAVNVLRERDDSHLLWNTYANDFRQYHNLRHLVVNRPYRYMVSRSQASDRIFISLLLIECHSK